MALGVGAANPARPFAFAGLRAAGSGPGQRIVVALGGNALLHRGERADSDVQERNVQLAIEALKPLARRHQLVLTHGNGPQVGVLAIESASDPALTRPYPLDSLVAETQGLIGYWMVQELQHLLPERTVAALVSRTLVDAGDLAFQHPTKFIGPVYTKEEAQRLAAERGWSVAADGHRWRRVVASPEPKDIVELQAIRVLLEAGAVVVCAGGGGVPVAAGPDGLLHGVEAVVDKDLTAALLAEQLGADALIILTDVDGVRRDFGGPGESRIAAATPAELRALSLPAGSMGPKVDAVCRFVERTGGVAAIGRLGDAAHLLGGACGTLVRRGGRPSSAC